MKKILIVLVMALSLIGVTSFQSVALSTQETIKEVTDADNTIIIQSEEGDPGYMH
ncbi:hypothetical protein [Bacillus marinisedimentorum]|uniref:hypothetical protein n=1 Tax=Bacillus marinisedimentorum TaxID=1821260 RepID=UPI0012FF85E6|nr:hypothetical protein [Bacillus marinisedimentorum]